MLMLGLESATENTDADGQPLNLTLSFPPILTTGDHAAELMKIPFRVENPAPRTTGQCNSSRYISKRYPDEHSLQAAQSSTRLLGKAFRTKRNIQHF
jgi:hypothetical protein